MARTFEPPKSTNSSALLHQDFSYDLPEEAIALHPVHPRSNARLLHYHRGHVSLDKRFVDLPELLPSGAQVWVNNTKVIRARMLLTKPTGGRLEVFLLEPIGQSMEQALMSHQPVVWRCLVRGGKRWSGGEATLKGSDALGTWSVDACLVGAEEGARHVQLKWSFHDRVQDQLMPKSFSELLEALGQMPLPPYMRRPEEAQDAEDYQTVYAEVSGSVAAPTAGLHFDESLLAEISAAADVHAVTLHVGAGTFKPLEEGQVMDHTMHGERCSVGVDSIRALSESGRHRVATGTTTLRTLESLYWLALKWKQTGIQPNDLGQWEWSSELAQLDEQLEWSMETAMQWVLSVMDESVWEFTTSIMIVPSYRIRSVEGLITNFHMPNSTLLCLVAAAIGEDWKKMYASALADGFRFLSFGDGSLLEWN